MILKMGCPEPFAQLTYEEDSYDDDDDDVKCIILAQHSTVHYLCLC